MRATSKFTEKLHDAVSWLIGVQEVSHPWLRTLCISLTKDFKRISGELESYQLIGVICGVCFSNRKWFKGFGGYSLGPEILETHLSIRG